LLQLGHDMTSICKGQSVRSVVMYQVISALLLIPTWSYKLKKVFYMQLSSAQNI